MQFNSKDALQAFVNDPEYQPYAKARQAGSSSQFYVIDDTDPAGDDQLFAGGVSGIVREGLFVAEALMLRDQANSTTLNLRKKQLH